MEHNDNRHKSNNQTCRRVVGVRPQTSRVRQFNDVITSLDGTIQRWIDDAPLLFITSFLGNTSREFVKDGMQFGHGIG